MIGRLARTMAITGAAFGALAPAAGAAVNFEPFRPYAVSSPNFIEAGDLNADGTSDIVAADASGGISALIGNGNGTLQDARPTPGAGGGISGLAVGDVTGDGRADVVTTEMPNKLWVYPGLGDGTFGAPTSDDTGTAPVDVFLARLNGDNHLDVVTADRDSQRASVFLNDGAGNFTAAAPVPTVGTNPTGVVVADFNRDGDNDLAIAAQNGTEGISYAEGNGDGTFVAPTTATDVPMADPSFPVAGDFNGDGRPDLAVSRPDVGDLVVAPRNAANTDFDAPQSESVGPGPGQPNRPAVADLDGDGDPDLAVPHSAGRVSVLIGGAGADFTLDNQEPVNQDPSDVVAADLNRDGNPDLAAAIDSPPGDGVAVLLATPPTVSVTPSLSFGDQAQSTDSTAQTIVVRNNGAPRLRPGAVNLGGPNGDQFRIVSNTCTNANLAIGQECGVGVVFRPTGTGSRSATVTVATNGGGSPHGTALSGNGVVATTGPIPGRCANLQNGTGAAETLTGTAEGDNLFGFAGNDVLNGLAGDDCLTGGDGNDRLVGGDGRDTLEGSNGNDVESGGNGNDRQSGGAGRDRMSGGAGNDSLNGGSSNDRLSGGSGNDTLNGSTGNDRISGSSGRNRYSGGSGNDSINARNRRTETIDCGTGRDTATVDRRDRVRRCERVRRSRR